MIGSAMVTMATDLFYVLIDLIWQNEILIQNAVQILAIFH
jgi:hypothetical protein